MQLLKDVRYTVRDYRSWHDDERWELIDGEVYDMVPGPVYAHQSLADGILIKLSIYLSGKPCKAISAPFDVYLSDDINGDTVVQPDVMVICDPSKIKQHGIVGAPDIVVEVLSPSTQGRDTIVKLRLYQREGVPEYWIVSPEEKTIYQHVMEDGQYKVNVVSEGALQSSRLPEFTMDVSALFALMEGFPKD